MSSPARDREDRIPARADLRGGALADEVGVSIPWTSPEVLSGASNGSVQSDVYSLAATIWNLLVGRSPFEIPNGDNGFLPLAHRVMNTPPPDTGRADVPDSLNRLLKQAMSKDPALRPRTALEFAQALQVIEQEQRFGRTELVVEGFGHAGEQRTPSATGGEDATRMRAQRVTAQPPAPTRTPPRQDPPREPETVSRPGLIRTAPKSHLNPTPRDRILPSDEAFPSTMRRAEVAAGLGADVAPAPRRRGLKPRTVVLAVSGVAVVAVVAGVILSSGGSDDHSDALPSTTPTGQTEVPELAPDPPTVVSSYDKATGQVTFTWRAADVQAGDSYLWAPADAPQQTTRIAATHLALKTTRPASTCIRVTVVRADGSSSTPSDIRCGSAG